MDRTEITSFYFTQFPEEVTEMELWNHFRKWGEVKEIFIPKRTEKGGGMVSSVTKGSLIKEESKRNWITAS